MFFLSKNTNLLNLGEEFMQMLFRWSFCDSSVLGLGRPSQGNVCPIGWHFSWAAVTHRRAVYNGRGGN